MRWKFNIKSKVDTKRLFFVRKLSIVRLFFYIGLTIAILGAMQPWFMWPFAAYYTLIAATFVFFSFLIDNGQQTHLFRREGFVIPIVLFFLSTFVMRLVNKNNIIRKLLLIFADDVSGMVFAAVIHENCFEIRKRLVNQYGIQTAA